MFVRSTVDLIYSSGLGFYALFTCSVLFQFGKQNFDWLVLFCLGRTVKHCFGISLLSCGHRDINPPPFSSVALIWRCCMLLQTQTVKNINLLFCFIDFQLEIAMLSWSKCACCTMHLYQIWLIWIAQHRTYKKWL